MSGLLMSGEPPAFDLRVVGGTLVGPRGRAASNLYVRDGRVALIDPAVHAARTTVDATDRLVLPGMVDTHVHLMDPGDTSREDFPTGTTAAARAGVTTIVEHTHGHPIRSIDDLNRKLSHLRGRAAVDYGLAAHVWPDRVRDLAALWEAGISFFKVFTCTTHGVPGLTPGRLQEVFQEVARFGGSCLVHCEDEQLTAEAERLLRDAGRTDPGALLDWRNRPAEELAVAAVVILARTAGARATIAHASTPEVVSLVTWARTQGGDVVAEACPQYLHLWESDLLTEGTLRKFTPPARIRSGEEEQAMWDLLESGGFGHVSTDHAPSTLAQKSEAGFWDAPFGLPGIDTTTPLMLTAAASGRLTLEQVTWLYSEAPARRYGLHPRKGHLGVGADADFILVEPTTRWTITNSLVVSKAGWTPYHGREVVGAVEEVYLRGGSLADARSQMRGRFVAGSGAGEHAGVPI